MFREISRRDLLRLGTIAMGTTVIAHVLTPSTGRGDTENGQLNTEISNNHGHVFSADLESLFKEGPRAYDIRGSSRHPHTLDITLPILETLRSVRVVDVDSSVNANHGHTVRLRIV